MRRYEQLSKDLLVNDLIKVIAKLLTESQQFMREKKVCINILIHNSFLVFLHMKFVTVNYAPSTVLLDTNQCAIKFGCNSTHMNSP